MSILVAIPYLPSMPDALMERMRVQANALYEANRGQIEVVMMDGTVQVAANRPRYSAHAAARNRLIDRYLLQPQHTHVLWIDSDITRYPLDLPDQLVNCEELAIVAPLVLIEDSQAFYDVHGFVEATGRAFSSAPPYARCPDGLIPCQSVGCCYLVPASLYYDGARYRATPGHTEHYSLCEAARQRGLPVIACRSIVVEHACLPRYGLAWN
jgi:hypothetical protein